MAELFLLLTAAIEAGTPLLLAVVGEILTEKAGNLNLGVEGLMTMGAMMGFLVSYATGNPLLGLLAAAGAGMLGSLLFAVLTVTLRANQVVTGLALTTLGVGLSGFVGTRLIGTRLPVSVTSWFRPVKIPLLADIPYIGPALFEHNFFVYGAILVSILAGIYIGKTKFGLNLRAVGENPASADASGISINLYKYVNIMMGGMLCGLGGAYLSMVRIPTWQDNVTAGRGWIAVALVIVAGWSPYKAIPAVIFFGVMDILGLYLQKYNLPISQYIINMAPYIATIAALVIISMGKSRKNAAPGSLSLPYFREDR